MLGIIVIMALISAPFFAIYGFEISHEISRAKQARRYARIMSDPRVVAAHLEAEQCKIKAKA
jgi:uncharacterized membrane protein affecting hemolysin expression